MKNIANIFTKKVSVPTTRSKTTNFYTNLVYTIEKKRVKNCYPSLVFFYIISLICARMETFLY